MTKTVALLPCPFCGGDDVKVHGPYGWYHSWCISHSCRTFYNGAQDIAQDFPSEAEAIAAWNTRTQTDQRGDTTQWADDMAAQMRAYYEAHKHDRWVDGTADNLMLGLLNIALRGPAKQGNAHTPPSEEGSNP